MASSSGVTIYDIAKRAGVSHTTVAAALRGSRQISDSRIEQIQKLADEMGYHPKLAAKLLRAKQTGHVGLLCMQHNDPGRAMEGSFDGPIMGHFISECDACGLGYHVQFVHTNDAPPPAIISNQLVDGVVVAGVVSEDLRKWLGAQQKVRWVSIAEMGPLCVLSAIDDGIYEAVQYLAALGHHRIAYAGGERIYLSGRLAYAGYQRAIDEFGLDRDLPLCPAEQCVNPRPEAMAFNVAWAETLLRGSHRPTAVICHDMPMARCIIYMAQKLGLSVPDDLSVIAVGTATDAEKGYPLMTTVEHDFKGMVIEAVKLLQRSIAGRQETAEPVRMSPHLVSRQSTGARPA